MIKPPCKFFYREKLFHFILTAAIFSAMLGFFVGGPIGLAFLNVVLITILPVVIAAAYFTYVSVIMVLNINTFLPHCLIMEEEYMDKPCWRGTWKTKRIAYSQITKLSETPPTIRSLEILRSPPFLRIETAEGNWDNIYEDKLPNRQNYVDIKEFLFSRVEAKQQRALSDAQHTGDNQGIVNSLQLLGDCKKEQGKYGEASAFYDHALEVLKRSEISKLKTAIVTARLADTRLSEGKTGEAEALYQQSIAMIDQPNAAISPELREILVAYAQLLHKLSRFGEANEIWVRLSGPKQ